jgi:hypothetical protein
VYFIQLVSDVSAGLHGVKFMDKNQMMKLKEKFSGLVLVFF